MLDVVIAVSNAVTAGASIVLVLGVFVAFLQFKASDKAERANQMNAVFERYSSGAMLRHVRAYVSWVSAKGETAPKKYCELEAKSQKVADEIFDELHNHRRQMSHSVLRIANGAELGAYSYETAFRVAPTMADDIKFLIGVEWLLARQIEARNGRPANIVYRRWSLVELFLVACVDRDRGYREFLPRRWPTPRKWAERRRELRTSKQVLLPRYRRFLEQLSTDTNYGKWAMAALSGADGEVPGSSPAPAVSA